MCFLQSGQECPQRGTVKKVAVARVDINRSWFGRGRGVGTAQSGKCSQRPTDADHEGDADVVAVIMVIFVIVDVVVVVVAACSQWRLGTTRGATRAVVSLKEPLKE